MKILLLSFYYTPDLCAGSFRTAALVKALIEILPIDTNIELMTTLPNRYCSFSSKAIKHEKHPRITVHRINIPDHKCGMIDQAKSFTTYAKNVLMLTRKEDYQLIFGTSSRLMTAILSACVARNKKIPLYLDIRDIFTDTIADVLPKTLTVALNPFLSILERWTMGRATKINLVSAGFGEYFLSRYPTKKYSFFTNGIDDEFIVAAKTMGQIIEDENNTFSSSTKSGGLARALYAGNMGEGQGLHAIIPELAKRLEGKVTFRLIGDGGRKPLLVKRLTELNCTNVEILPPVKRERLLLEYQEADILFLHLNDYNAFKKVLPSKIFEYAAMGKPVWAGVAGYAADFIKGEVDNAAIFQPCDVESAVQSLLSLKIENIQRNEFIKKYSRDSIMHAMATDILTLLPTAR